MDVKNIREYRRHGIIKWNNPAYCFDAIGSNYIAGMITDQYSQVAEVVKNWKRQSVHAMRQWRTVDGMENKTGLIKATISLPPTENATNFALSPRDMASEKKRRRVKMIHLDTFIQYLFSAGRSRDKDHITRRTQTPQMYYSMPNTVAGVTAVPSKIVTDLL